MKQSILVFSIIVGSLFFSHCACQEMYGMGIGIFPTGSETGIDIRSSKDKRFAIDARIVKTSVFFHANSGSVINELSVIYRSAYFEKIRFHIGLGGRVEWNLDPKLAHRSGVVVPLGVEAFPFPFQNGGLFFEVAPFFTSDKNNFQNIGIRTTSGFIYYFTKQKKHEKI